MGMLLSLPMVLVGVALIALALRARRRACNAVASRVMTPLEARDPPA